MFILVAFLLVITAPVWVLWLLIYGAVELVRWFIDCLEKEADRGNARP